MSSDVCRANIKITLVIRDSGEGNSNPTMEFKCWSNNFDGLRFFYDHLSNNEDVNKVKTISCHQMFQNLRFYLMKRITLS